MNSTKEQKAWELLETTIIHEGIRSGSSPAPTAARSSDLLAVMGENPCELTAKKTAWMMERDKMQVTGFVVTSPTGLIGIVDKSAVRWLLDSEMWWLMHDSPTPINSRSMTNEEKQCADEFFKKQMTAND